MKQKDHKALAYYLLDNIGEGSLWKGNWHRRFFLLGCIGPDYIPITYLRGFRKSHAMLGHNAPYSMRHIQKSIGRLQKRGVKGLRDCLKLGALMHYLADSFTLPHTEQFLGNMRDHRQYENELHGCFSRYLAYNSKACLREIDIHEKLTDFLTRIRKEYENAEKCFERDCRQILAGCSGVFQRLSTQNV